MLFRVKNAALGETPAQSQNLVRASGRSSRQWGSFETAMAVRVDLRGGFHVALI
jgi:hypothetical protein